MTIYKSWNHYLKIKRIEKKLTKQEISSKLGISQEYYERVELGSIRPSLTLFRKLYKLLELDEITCVTLMKQDYLKEQGAIVVEEGK